MTLPLDTAPYFTGDQLSYSATGLPQGLAIDTQSGMVSGTPQLAGTTTVTVTAANPAGSAAQVFDWTITEAGAGTGGGTSGGTGTDVETGAQGHWFFGTDYTGYDDLVSGQTLTPLIPSAVSLGTGTLTISDGSGAGDAMRGLETGFAQAAEQTICLVASPEAGNRIMGGNLTTSNGSGIFMQGTGLRVNARARPHNNVTLEDPVSQTAPFIFLAHAISATANWVAYRGGDTPVVQTGGPINPAVDTSNPIGIGNTVYASGSFTAGGSYAELIVFNSYKTETEIAEIYARSKTRLAARGVTVL